MGTNDWSPSRKRDASSAALQLSLSELTEQAAVTVRTVRYYIAEGLVPPPVTAGRQSYYTRGHLDRLRLIARLKEAYLPLREIRRQLAGLDDAAVRDLLAQDDAASAPESTSARAYLDQVLGAPPAQPGPTRPPRPQPRQRQRRPSLRDESPGADDVYAVSYEPAPPAEQPKPLTSGAATVLPPSPAAPGLDPDAAPEAWRRVRLGDDAELLVRESAYQQRRDRIDWLIRWARRVFR